jgi:hypothetical protein
MRVFAVVAGAIFCLLGGPPASDRWSSSCHFLMERTGAAKLHDKIESDNIIMEADASELLACYHIVGRCVLLLLLVVRRLLAAAALLQPERSEWLVERSRIKHNDH